jgi:hypothetical protein
MLPGQQARRSAQNPARGHLLYSVRKSYCLGNLHVRQTLLFRLRYVILDTGFAIASYRRTKCHKFVLSRSQMRHGFLASVQLRCRGCH